MSDVVRVLRIIEYVGDRLLVENQLKSSVHGFKQIHRRSIAKPGLYINVRTISAFPDILTEAERANLEEHIDRLADNEG